MVVINNTTKDTFVNPENDANKILNMADTSNIEDKNNFRYAKTYIFTTEYIMEYYKKLDLMNQSILTVCSSGDHAFNAILNGASKADTFDINVFAGYYMYFKKAMIESIGYNEFINSFNININSWNSVTHLWTVRDFLTIFEKIHDKLDENVLKFWQIISEELIKEMRKPKNYFKNYFNYFFIAQESKFCAPLFINYRPIACNEYLASENKYCELQERLKGSTITFTNCDITQLPNIFKTKYDYIFTSNISDYLKKIYKDDYLNRYRDFIINGLSSLLNNNGFIAVAYLYSDCNDMSNPMMDKEKREKVFDSSFGRLGAKNDVVITYRKNGLK